MDPALVKTFFDSVAKTFEFLVREHGFTGPHLEVNEDIYFAYATFNRDHVAIECVCDQRDEHVDCLIALVSAAHRSTIDGVDESGRRVREDVYHWARRHGAEDPLFPKPGKLPFLQRIPIKLENFAEMLRTYGAAVLADDPKVLE